MPDPAFNGRRPTAPLFFLSYARARTDNVGGPHDSNRHVLTLYDDLIEFLNQLVPVRAGAAIGFIDREMRTGAFWNEQLRHALGTCQVFVPLVSAPYFGSEWCGREWGGFSSREIKHRSGDQLFNSAIAPVTWAPDDSGWVPRVAERVQRFTPGQGYEAAEYGEHGVYGLLALNKIEEYKIVAWRLARHIAQIYYGCQVLERDFDEKPAENVFLDLGQEGP